MSNEHPGHAPRVIISYKIRSLAKETVFWSAFGLWFSFHPVLAHNRQPVGFIDSQTEDDHITTGNEPPHDPWARYGSADENDQFIFVASRRPESFAWDVPASNDDLLAGVGAWGTSTSKSDDTFESLLLMGLDMEIQ